MNLSTKTKKGNELTDPSLDFFLNTFRKVGIAATPPVKRTEELFWKTFLEAFPSDLIFNETTIDFIITTYSWITKIPGSTITTIADSVPFEEHGNLFSVVINKHLDGTWGQLFLLEEEKSFLQKRLNFFLPKVLHSFIFEYLADWITFECPSNFTKYERKCKRNKRFTKKFILDHIRTGGIQFSLLWKEENERLQLRRAHIFMPPGTLFITLPELEVSHIPLFKWHRGVAKTKSVDILGTRAVPWKQINDLFRMKSDSSIWVCTSEGNGIICFTTRELKQDFVKIIKWILKCEGLALSLPLPLKFWKNQGS
jgi:hypothetical protein